MTGLLLELLAESQQLGFLGPGPIGSHVPHAIAYASAIPGPARALDLGAGGGLPGLVLAASAWPETRWTFLDAQARRIDFLGRAVAALGIDDRVEVRLGRAEEVGREAGLRTSFDAVVARSFGAPAVVAECAAPFLCPGGHLIVSEPPTEDLERRWPVSGLALLGFGPADRVVIDVSGRAEGAPRVHLARCRQLEPCPERFPRRTGVPAKRPLFGGRG